jgi:hypothetical protein
MYFLYIIAIVLIIAVAVVLALFTAGCFKKKVTQETIEELELPTVCRIWDRWRRLNQPLSVNSNQNLLGGGWLQTVCPAKYWYQQINQKDHWCTAQPRIETAVICSQYISQDEVAVPLPATVANQSTLAPFDRWVQLKQSIGLADAKYQGSAWQVSVCPEGSAFQLLADQEAWCVPTNSVNEATIAAAAPVS